MMLKEFAKQCGYKYRKSKARKGLEGIPFAFFASAMEASAKARNAGIPCLISKQVNGLFWLIDK